jgi:lysophospholipase L1-like esterase
MMFLAVVITVNAMPVLIKAASEQEQGIKVTDKEAESYFSGAVFIGDSVTEGIAQYVRTVRKNKDCLSDAKFLSTTIGIRLADCAGDMGTNTFYYSYKGEQKPIEQCVFEMGVSKAFIMLGMNDLVDGFSVSDTIDRYNRTLDKITLQCPDVEIILMLNTPKTGIQWLPWYCANKDFGNVLINEFVEAVKVMCDDRLIKYIDLNTILKDENGALPKAWCRDDYVHLNNAGSETAVKAMYEFAKEVISSEKKDKKTNESGKEAEND